MRTEKEIESISENLLQHYVYLLQMEADEDMLNVIRVLIDMCDLILDRPIYKASAEYLSLIAKIDEESIKTLTNKEVTKIRIHILEMFKSE